MINLFRKLPVNNVIFFNDWCVFEYSKVMKQTYSVQNVVPIGILPAPILKERKIIPHQIVSIGNLVAFKTYNQHVIKAIASLHIEFPDISYEIYGDGPERERLMKLALLLGVERFEKFHGQFAYHFFSEGVSSASVFVGSGTAILEAAQLAVPCIVGIDSIEKPYTYGFLYECDGYTYNELVESRQLVPIEQKLREVFNGGKEVVISIGEKCRIKSNEFTIDKTVDGFINIEHNLKPITRFYLS
jgi:1,2-diacylglycerol 3-alpha-glucosyltransferase